MKSFNSSSDSSFNNLEYFSIIVYKDKPLLFFEIWIKIKFKFLSYTGAIWFVLDVFIFFVSVLVVLTSISVLAKVKSCFFEGPVQAANEFS